MTKADLGKRVRAHRLLNHMSQQKAAARIQISQQRLSAIERGLVDPRTTTLWRIMEGLDVMPNDFFGPVPFIGGG